MKTYKELKILYDESKENFNDNFTTRIHRSLSWLEKAEKENEPDANFIFLWISFNGAYSSQEHNHSYDIRSDFFTLIYHFGKKEIDEIIETNFKNEIYPILNNEFLIESYWHGKGYNYENEKAYDINMIHEELNKRKKNCCKILEKLFQRLNILRNQIFHGYTTYNSSVNRISVITAAKLMQIFVPFFLEIMIKNYEENWGEIDFHPDGINKK
tara:strand:+ start:222 stop:860 length:639 start_codon:yes stop_codon:yes gene_type:complete